MMTAQETNDGKKVLLYCPYCGQQELHIYGDTRSWSDPYEPLLFTCRACESFVSINHGSAVVEDFLCSEEKGKRAE